MATAADFRRLALALPDTSESAHMHHADFRLRGKVFATLDSPREGWGMVRLPPSRQAELVHRHPDVFVPANGAWGRQGCTYVELDKIDATILGDALRDAWQRLLEEPPPRRAKPR